MTEYISKNFSASYLYEKTGYEKKLFEFIVGGEEIDKSSQEFSDILSDFKRRQVTSSLVNILMDARVVLKISGVAVPKAFKVMYARDPRDKNNRVFIDLTDILTYKNGVYSCKSIDVLIAYVISAGMMLTYFNEPRKIHMNNTLVTSATSAFVYAFSYILDYLRINGISAHKKQIMYLAATYFQHTMLGKPLTDSVRSIALRISGLKDIEASVVDMRVEKSDLTNIDTFIAAVAKILSTKELTTEVFVDKWANLFGTGTYFASELFIAFSTMITDAYVGCYINNQKTIEKVIGRDIVTYTSALLKAIGSGDYD